ncbi:MAG: type 4a pilus biogenesis protein PilO [Bdellovibrionales bacterium]|nr:type 4a pilus biogenesis protein PilO [Bdellovibrionales bacterium]
MGVNFSLFRSIQIGVLFAVLYYVSVFDSGDGIKKETEKIVINTVKQKENLKKIIKKENDLKVFSDLFNDLTLQVGVKILNILNSNSQGDSFPHFLSSNAENLNLSILGLANPSVSKDKNWEIQEIQLSVEGRYHQLMKFIANIQNEDKLIIIKKNTLSIAGSSSESIIKLRANLSVRLYQYIASNE